ncbi:MAE_28990/MAE_18760 family HEPN-like nuclease [Oceanisphaera sp. IT1-181]|uniref:MAE_28990/MAE_18760 family HEPN-like nuclease n=1 Tax=Oceanisphaera sp. IT1-181 TaxID=3081199 RepID=UPI0029CA8A50|nr:MAE_28990/MAE_18760 family HEPN-like nuclease [Oceanisphaera sp. IT1-181]
MNTRIREDKFLQKISEEYSWRRRELILYNTKLPTNESPIQNVFLRASIPFIYGHWEGFVKVCMSLYLRYVSELQLKHSQLKTPFIALSLSNSISSFDSKSIFKKVELVDLMFEKLESRSNIPKKNIINTKANLKYDVLQEILFNVNLKDHGLETKSEVINSLVETRNYIAHGEYKHISYDTYNSFNEEVLYLLERIKTIIENSAVNKDYLK